MTACSHSPDDVLLKGPKEEQQQKKELHIAPMIHVSNREFRALFRILSKRATLWTEMVVDESIHHNIYDSSTFAVPEHLLDPAGGDDNPVVCQIGGIRPDWTATTTRAVLAAGYDEINLNLDCPSEKVQGKLFGAVLMKYPEKTVELLKAMLDQAKNAAADHTRKPISVKCRIGVDDCTEYDWLVQFIEKLSTVCHRFILHARAVWLQGLWTPAQNRSVPPLDYGVVYRLCDRFPHLQFWINGGIRDLQTAKAIAYGTTTKSPIIMEDGYGSVVDDRHAVPCCRLTNGSCTAPPMSPAPTNLRGCMLGRAAMDNPAQFWDVDRYFYNDDANPVGNRREILDRYCAFLEQLYPRRCCDDNPERTCRIPAPRVVHSKQHCNVCGNSASTMSEDTNNVSQKEEPIIVKISSHIIDRSLKPFLGIFYQQAGSKTFRRVCFELSRDLVVRNCGPAFILRKAVQESISDDILDQPLERTEDLVMSKGY